MKFPVENITRKARKIAWVHSVATVFCICCVSSTCFGSSSANSALQDQSKHQDKIHDGVVPRRTHGAKTRPTIGLGSEASPHSTPPEANASPAKVFFNRGLLTVDADNSDLSQILRTIAEVSGMTIDGSVTNVRVFGMYGPSNSRQVLTNLLKGLGYNFIMTGVTAEGAPRYLQLALRSAAVPASSDPAISTHSDTPDTHTDDQGQPGPGAILHVPPATPDDTQDRMRQNLQRLQQMHDQQKPQNAPQ